MKQKQLLIRFFFAIVLLISLMAQSFHGYEHLQRQFSKKICLHKHTNSAELTHQHKSFEQCLVCAISFPNGITEEQFCCQLQYEYHFVSNYSFTFPTIISFSGSSYSLRGPPQYNV